MFSSESVQRQQTVSLNLVRNEGGRTDDSRRWVRIDLSPFPTDRGVYVIRYEDRLIPRLRGDSAVLKIGSASEGFRSRFENYNKPGCATDPTWDFRRLIYEYRNPQWQCKMTDAFLMFFLSHWKGSAKIAVDLYQVSADARAVELEFLDQYCEAHYELPPLNLGFK